MFMFLPPVSRDHLWSQTQCWCLSSSSQISPASYFSSPPSISAAVQVLWTVPEDPSLDLFSSPQEHPEKLKRVLRWSWKEFKHKPKPCKPTKLSKYRYQSSELWPSALRYVCPLLKFPFRLLFGSNGHTSLRFLSKSIAQEIVGLSCIGSHWLNRFCSNDCVLSLYCPEWAEFKSCCALCLGVKYLYCLCTVLSCLHCICTEPLKIPVRGSAISYIKWINRKPQQWQYM